MRLTPLEVKRGQAFHTWTSSDRPEVYPGSRKRPFLQTEKTSRNRFQTFSFFQHRPAEPNRRHPAAFFESTTEIEYP